MMRRAVSMQEIVRARADQDADMILGRKQG